MTKYTAKASKAHGDNQSTTNDQQNREQLEAQLESEGLGVLEGTALLPGGENGQEKALYLGTPVSAGDSEGIDIPEVDQAEESLQDAIMDPLPETCPVLSRQDGDLVHHIRELGGAATLSEVAGHPGAEVGRIAGGDFAGNGVAFYREFGGHTLIALAGATDSDLMKAANRAEADRIGYDFETSVKHAGRTASAVVNRLQSLGGSGSLSGMKSHLAAGGFVKESVRPVLSELYRRGLIRVNVQADTRTRFVTLAESLGAPEGSLARAAQRVAVDNAEIPSRMAEAAERARKRGQDKGFAAPFVPFGGTRVTPEQQQRALYVESRKAAYYEAELKGVEQVSIKLAATATLPAEEVTLYTAEPDGAREFATARIKGRILTGLARNGKLQARRMLPVLFPQQGPQITTLLSEGRDASDLSPALAEPYSLFAAAVNELISEGKVERTREGLALIPAEKREQATRANGNTAELADSEDFADQDPEPERQSGPDAHGSDKYAADMAGAHDHRPVASGPQSPSTRPGQRRRTARWTGAAVRKSRTSQKTPTRGTSSEASLQKAECKQAWNKARALYMAGISPEDRLELFLKLEGEQRLERMLEAAAEPDELYRAVLALQDEGRLQTRKSGGYTLISATADLDREHLAADLVALMARVGSTEIAIPESTALARKVEEASAKAKTEASRQLAAA